MIDGSEYWTRLRAAWGPGQLLTPGVSVLPTDRDGRVLLIRTSDFGQWGLVGGRVELDEDPADAARREALEETGCTVRLDELVGVYGGPDFVMTYANGDRTSFVITLYRATITGGTPMHDGSEGIELGWFTLDELATLDLAPCPRAVLRGAGLL